MSAFPYGFTIAAWVPSAPRHRFFVSARHLEAGRFSLLSTRRDDQIPLWSSQEEAQSVLDQLLPAAPAWLGYEIVDAALTVKPGPRQGMYRALQGYSLPALTPAANPS
jgi:hypothetical protein